MSFNKALLFFTIFSITLISCQDEKPITGGSPDLTYMPNDNIDFIKPPFLDRDIEQEVFLIDAQKDEEIITESGSKITVYKNTIVDNVGEVVVGNVKIEYRDFHNPLEVYLSGIPMGYDSAGVRYVFETAGMFELKAYQKEQLLGLKKGKKMDVDLISTSNETDFNFYSFDESNGVWLFKNEPMRIATTLKNKMAEKREVKELIKPIAQNVKNYAFDIDVNKKQYPELEVYEGTIFEVRNNASFNPIYYNVQWDKVEIYRKNKDHYVLELFKEDTSIVVAVKPVIKSEKYAQAKIKYNEAIKNLKESIGEQSDFDVYSKSLIAYNSSMSAQATIMRQMSLNGFGIYNCDKPGIFNPSGVIKELIAIKNGEERKVENKNFSVVDLSKNAVVLVYGAPKYYKNRNTILWAIMNNEEMLIAFPEEIQAMLDDKKLRSGTYSIQEGLEILGDVIASR
tara:strand:+ start:4942 stop:6300 length:1359 start_codon:yes stop_codon:yes gene_type:complete